ncbi:Uncharacterized protein SCF082_LOCUS5701 [Durusdinium trenchii]|uniref:Uncharacterized protein n=1 Tax=Durusdinium trenchii TaxID=1381693 RepID=A0ABP0I9I4_9DINO
MMVLRAGLCLLAVRGLLAAPGFVEQSEVVRHSDPRRLLEVLTEQYGDDPVSRQALEVSRRLFDFAGLTDSIGGAAKWCQDTVSQASNKVVGVQEAASLIQSANGYIGEGTQLTGQAWTSMLELGTKMTGIYQDFQPLEPAFAKASGAMEITTNQGMLSQLVHCVRSIISSNSILDVLGTSLDKALGIFSQIKDTVVSVVSKLGGRRLREAGREGRMLYDYNQLLEGIDFDWISKKIQGFVATIKTQAENLVDIDTILGPMLAQMDKTGQVTRRLDIISQAQQAVGGVGSLKEQAEKNARAISKVIPTWQAVEGTSVQMCPSVLATKDTISNLKCRTTEFVSKAGVGSWVPSEVTNIVAGCPATLPTQEQAIEAGCPKKAYSAGVKDVLGENSNALGWAMAVGGSAAGLGICGIAGAKMMKKGEDEDDSDDGNSSEQGPLTE